jgi:phosphatidylserine/phosphatidylglycerophosphate/cardiolipin synthase-like enzyme
VQLGVNFGCGQPLTDIPRPIRSGGALIRNLLRNCQTFFYGEDQYGVGNRELEDAIKQAFANGARYGIVVLAGTAVVDDIPEIAYRRYRFWSRFPQIGRNLLVFERLGDDGKPDGPHAYVHSKLFLVDDRAATIGSLNMNRRSWYNDSEIAVVVADAPSVIRDLRLDIWRDHLTLAPTDDIRDPIVSFGIWQTLYAGVRRMPRIRPLYFAKEPPRASDDVLRRVGSVSSYAGPLLGPLGGLVLDTSLDAVRTAINGVLDVAFDRIYDPSGPSSC